MLSKKIRRLIAAILMGAILSTGLFFTPTKAYAATPNDPTHVSTIVKVTTFILARQNAQNMRTLEKVTNLINKSASKVSQAERVIESTRGYDTYDDVANYIIKFGRLPSNYITKAQAKGFGWEKGRDLWKYASGKSIGGGIYRNADGQLPQKIGRVWRECDIGYSGGKRAAERLVYSNDGLFYKTVDHYKSFIRIK